MTEQTMDFTTAKAKRDALTEAHEIAAAALRVASGTERGPMGLTPDHIKVTDTWRAAYLTERTMFRAMADHNRMMARTFKKELRAERLAARKATA